MENASTENASMKNAMYRFVLAAIHRSRAVLFVLAGLVIGGLISYTTLPREADPDIPIPYIYVGVVLPGIAPDDAERLLVKPLEFELRQLTGLKEIQGIAAQNFGAVVLEFDVSFDKDKALADVRDKVDKARAEFPEDAEEPDIREFNAGLFPVIMVNLTSQGSQRELYSYARKLKDEISAMPSVLEANLVGHREEVLEIIIDPRAMENYNITADDLYAVLGRNNQLIPAGNLDNGTGRFSISVPGLVESPDDIYTLSIKKEGDAVVRLSDIATIKRGFKDMEVFARYNGVSSISVEVVKRLGANVVETTRNVRTITNDFTANWPDSIKVGFSSDISNFIFEMIGSLEISITNAILLVMILMIAALGIRSSLLVGLSIPTSFLVGFLIINLMGYTLNMMIMFGLVLSVGILVDGAIVVVEYADRKMAEGVARQQAYAMAANRMFWPILSSTGTTLAAFAPMLFWPGVSGKFMSYLPITVIFILSASLITTMIFLPVIGGLIGKSEQAGDATLNSLAAESQWDIATTPGMTGAYLRLLAGCIKRPIITLGSAVIILATIIVLFGRYNNGVEFSVDIEPYQANVFIKARGNLSVEEANIMTRHVEDIVLSTPGVEHALAQAGPALGSQAGGGFGDETPPDIVGLITLEFTHFSTRPNATFIMRNIEQRANALPGINVEVIAREQGPPTGTGIEIEISGQNFEDLNATTRHIRQYLADRPELYENAEDTRALPGIEWNLVVDREAAGRFNADITSIGNAVQLVTNGILVGHYRPDDSEDELEIRVRYPKEARSFNQLDRLRVATPDGNVPITNFVKRQAVQLVNNINRVDGNRIITVTAETMIDPVTGDQILVSVAEQNFLSWLAQQKLPNGIKVRLRGANEEAAAASDFLGGAMMASLLLMFVILLLQFNSLYCTFLTLSTVILSTVGVLLGMIVTGQTFSVIMTGTGVVALAGIVVNNSIVLIDTYQRLLETGMEKVEAVLKTAGQRLRPILLTTITTMIGLLPMALQTSVDIVHRTIEIGAPTGGWWVPLSTAIIFGLGFSTLLTLILVPVMLTVPAKLHHLFISFDIQELFNRLIRQPMVGYKTKRH